MEDCDFANLIVKGFKTYETRKSRSLDPYIGKRVGIIRTQPNTQAELIGFVDIGEDPCSLTVNNLTCYVTST